VQLRAYVHREALLDAWASLRAPVVAIALVAVAWRLGRPLWLLASLLLAVLLDPATAVVCTVALILRVLVRTGSRLSRAWRNWLGGSAPSTDPPASSALPASPSASAADPSPPAVGVMDTLRAIMTDVTTTLTSPPVQA
jgi:hypothetical protein